MRARIVAGDTTSGTRERAGRFFESYNGLSFEGK